VGAIAAGAGLAVSEHRYRGRLDDLDEASAAIAAAQTQGDYLAGIDLWNRRDKKVQSAYLVRQGFVWARAGGWGLGLLDAVAFVPKPGAPAWLGGASQGPRGRNTQLTMTLARVRF